MSVGKLIGMTFGRWTVIKLARAGTHTTQQKYLCRCKCGTEKLIPRNNLVRGVSQSCGCLRREKLTTHGLSRIPENQIWRQMLLRCRDTSNRNYGGRGITVCKHWNNFKNFIADMGCRPSDAHSIERRDNNKGYSKSNCYWATQAQQNLNTRRNRIIKTPWGKLTVTEAAHRSGITRATLAYRIQKGWPKSQLFAASKTGVAT